MPAWKTWFVLSFSFAATLAGADECQTQLAASQKTSPIRTVVVGDEAFSVLGLLSDEGDSVLYRLADGDVLRTFKPKPDPESAARDFIYGYEGLVANGVRKLAHMKRRGRAFVVQEFHKVEFSLEAFLQNADRLAAKNLTFFEQLVDGLVAFARTTIRFSQIGDFHAGQLIWNGKDWLLLDWNGRHEYAHRDSQVNFFFAIGAESPTPMTKFIWLKVYEAIADARLHALRSPPVPVARVEAP